MPPFLLKSVARWLAIPGATAIADEENAIAKIVALSHFVRGGYSGFEWHRLSGPVRHHCAAHQLVECSGIGGEPRLWSWQDTSL